MKDLSIFISIQQRECWQHFIKGFLAFVSYVFMLLSTAMILPVSVLLPLHGYLLLLPFWGTVSSLCFLIFSLSSLLTGSWLSGLWMLDKETLIEISFCRKKITAITNSYCNVMDHHDYFCSSVNISCMGCRETRGSWCIHGMLAAVCSFLGKFPLTHSKILVSEFLPEKYTTINMQL